ncbi:MAG: site-specific DNA-methyltransferase [Chthoniobacterales bacterium]|nr:site-specific DNA-methyltransferase [Chthoniobacterales bacterium]
MSELSPEYRVGVAAHGSCAPAHGSGNPAAAARHDGETLSRDADISPLTPYYQDALCTIYHGDCNDVLPKLKKIDLVIADPPYGVQYRSNHRQSKFNFIAGDDTYPSEWLDGVNKIVERGTIYLFCNEASLGDAQRALAKHKWSSNRLLIWDKQSTSGGNLANYGQRTEYVCYGTKMFAPKLNGSRDGNLISIPRVRPQDLTHPAEKPYLLMAYLVMKSTNPGEVVCDPFCGSGVVLKAAKDLGRPAVGIELEEHYCEIAARRLSQESFNFTGGDADFGVTDSNISSQAELLVSPNDVI